MEIIISTSQRLADQTTFGTKLSFLDTYWLAIFLTLLSYVEEKHLFTRNLFLH
jgi:hypothetical protein